MYSEGHLLLLFGKSGLQLWTLTENPFKKLLLVYKLKKRLASYLCEKRGIDINYSRALENDYLTVQITETT